MRNLRLKATLRFVGDLFRDQAAQSKKYWATQMDTPNWLEDDSVVMYLPGFGPKQTSDKSDANPASTTIRRLRVLLVEDDKVDASLVRSSLKHVVGVTFDFVTVATASEAVDQLEAGGIQLVLLDLGLPDSSGLDTIHRLGVHLSAIPVIVLTGIADDDVGVQAIQHGAQDYLVKGASAAALTRAIRYALSRHRMRRKLRQALENAKVGENNLRMIIENNLDGIVVVDQNGLVVHANAAAESLFAYPAGTFIGQPSPLKLTSDSERVINIVNCQNRIMPTEVRFNTIEWNGQPASLVLLRDLTERRQAESNRHKLELAREVQQGLLPKAPPKQEGIDIAGASVTADETGGDYFDYVPMPGGVVGLVVADASGHGIASALLISVVSAYIRAFGSLTSDPGEVLRRVAQILGPRICEGQFITTVLACVDPVRRTVAYASAGHPSALLIDASGSVQADLTSLDFPIGLDPDHWFKSSSVSQLQSGQTLVLISDGILEAMRPDGTLFGKQRVIEHVRSHLGEPSHTIVETLIDAVKRHCAPGTPADDLTVVVARIE